MTLAAGKAVNASSPTASTGAPAYSKRALSWPLSAGRMFQISLAEPSALKTLMASPSVQTMLTSRTAARVRLPPSMVAVTLFWMFSGI